MTRPLVLALVLLAGCSHAPVSVLSPTGVPLTDQDKRPSKPSATTLSLNPRNWDVLALPSNDYGLRSIGSALGFDFRSMPSTIHYLWTAGPRNVTGLTAFVSMRVVGSATFGFNDPCGNDVSYARPYLQASNDWVSNNGRWWADVAFDLRTSDATIVVPYTADRWTNVVGQHDAAGFAAAIKNISGLGVTFGSCFFGHGIGITSGAAQFQLLSYEVH